MDDPARVGSAILIEDAAEVSFEKQMRDAEQATVEIVNSRPDVTDINLIPGDDGIALIESAGDGHAQTIRSVEPQRRREHGDGGIAPDRQRVHLQRRLEA